MKKIILKFSVLMVVIFISVLFVVPAMIYADDITILAIAGVTVPVTGATPVATATTTEQYSATVTWSGSPATFAPGTAYTATIAITAISPYVVQSVANIFSVAGATLTTNAADGSGIVTAVFPATADAVIATQAIAGVTVPVIGATPVSTIADTTEYTATIAWSGSPVTFAASTVYTATITITPKTGYTLTGVTANFFTVIGATATNDANLGIVTAVFPATAAASITITGIGPISGTPQVGVELTAGALTPSGATATYQWQIADTSGGIYADIGGATLNKYTPVAGDVGKFIRVVATGTAGDTGTATSDPTTAAVVAAAVIQPTVPLGATSTFAVLAYSLISDAGAASIINGAGGGDVGLSPTTGTAITGLTSAHVSGTIYVVSAAGPAGYVINPSLLTTAKNDLEAAYSNAAGRTPTQTFTGNNSLAGKILTSGVYAFASGTTDLDGTLTLDAQGDENAVFIFQASSSLITASASRVELINGARYCRVFWVVPSSATLGSGSIFVGHIFAYASISVTSGTTVYGQLLARTGAVTLDHDTITNGPCETTTPAETPATPDVAPVVTAADTTEDRTAATATIPVTATVTGGQLPKTATPWYNILLAGAALMLIGAVGGVVGWKTRKIHE
jgi:LPXTG-motif cell wall-anchored protein